jgi:hypothetical protein
VTEHDVFVSGEVPATAVRAVIAAALGTMFRSSHDPEPVPALAVGGTKVFFHDDRPFDDDADFPVSRYRYWVSVEDSDRDEERQAAVASRVLGALKAQGWPVMLSHGLQGNLAVYP